MLSSLYSGISGLLSNSTTLNVVGNNISNVNTTAYKSQRATFEDCLYQYVSSSSGTGQVGRGSALASIDTNFSQGSFETTNSSTDLAIGDSGFFIVRSRDSLNLYYTRAGNFSLAENGNLVNPSGYILQAKQIDPITGTAYGVDVDVNISSEPSAPRATGIVDMVTNLQSNATSTATINNLSTGAVTGITVNENGYPWAGDYTSVIDNVAAASITQTGTNAATTGAYAGTVEINGVTITATAADYAAFRAAINAQTATTHVAASDSGGNLVLTATVDGTDIVFDDTGLTTGTSGWTDSDKASKTLYGSTLTLTVPEVISGVVTPTNVVGRLSSQGGPFENWEGTGLDIATTGSYILAEDTQTFNVRGFTYADGEITTSITPATTSNYSSSITVYDSLGQAHSVTVYFRKDGVATDGTSTWQWNAVVSGSDWSYLPTETPETYHLVGSGYLTFNANGVLTSGGTAQTLNFDFSGAGADQNIDLIMGSASGGGSTTQYDIASTTTYQSQDGYAPGTLESVSVDENGVISGTYTNGQILRLYQITLANFNNDQGLKKEGGNLYTATADSGPAYTSAPDGSISANSLEESNVDLATEFVKLIVAQRGYEASSKVITTTDEVLQTLMNLKR
jgi:flagellar hook protein FlgE